jgi:hypothetical protein
MDGELQMQRCRTTGSRRRAPSLVDRRRNEGGGGCRSIKSDGKRIRFLSPFRTIVQRHKHYSHEPYRKVKTGLNTATAAEQYLPAANRQPVNGFQPLFSEIVIFDCGAVWKIYAMNIWRRQSQLPTKS